MDAPLGTPVIRITAAPRRPLFWVFAALLAITVTGCQQRQAATQATAPAPLTTPEVTQPPGTAHQATPTHDLSNDESMGGHTLERHVGKTDAELSERLRREPQISSASTYTDQASAERAVGTAIASAGGKMKTWLSRRGRRPNLVLHYFDRSGPSIGRSLSRRQTAPTPCHRALVVIRWDERRHRSFVLTSYPEADR
jgi:Bacterial CdiA-CT RNAse A domain